MALSVVDKIYQWHSNTFQMDPSPKSNATETVNEPAISRTLGRHSAQGMVEQRIWIVLVLLRIVKIAYHNGHWG